MEKFEVRPRRPRREKRLHSAGRAHLISKLWGRSAKVIRVVIIVVLVVVKCPSPI